MENPQSFTARRPAASNLPTFQLPPPDLGNVQKYPYAPQSHGSQSLQQSVNSVLTPPVGLQNEGVSPLSPAVNGASSQSSGNGLPSYNPMGYWPPQQSNTQQYSFSSAPSMPSPFAQNQNSMYIGRQLYSPSVNYPQQRSANSSATDDNLPQPPYQLSLPPFPTPVSLDGPSGSQANLPNLAQQSHQQNSQAQQNHQHHQQQQMVNSIANPQQAGSQSSQQSSSHAPENYGPRPPPTPTYSYGSTSTPQQSSFPAYTQPSPSQQSPITSAAPQNRISPVSANHPSSMHPPPASYGRPYGSYSLPTISGPIMSNVHNPGNQMALVGGMPMQGYPHPGMAHQMYGGHPGAQPSQNDRPFKCDQCPQSFNRNHDLKRHKRIHLAVKPYPCSECEKSFSRKDALKRHVLVKGCGKPVGGGGGAAGGGRNSHSPLDKSEVMSDSTEDSPAMLKKEFPINRET